MKKFFKQKNLILAIVIFGAIFRFYNPNWDSGHYFHPDERNIAASVSRIKFFSQMNPGFFAYGSFPIYLYRATGETLDYFSKEKGWVYDWTKINIVGRVWSAFFSTLTLIFLYKLARKLFDRKVALVALFLTSFTVFLIQTAHYAVTESMLSFYVVVITYLSIQLLKKPSFTQTFKLSLIAGLALATKTSAITFLLPPILAFLYLVIKNLKHKHFDHSVDYGFKMVIFLALSAVIFIITDPYILLDFRHFRESMNYEGGIVTGNLVVVYVYQFIKTQPYLYWIKNWFFTQGPLLASTSIVGSLYFIYLILKSLIFRYPYFLSHPDPPAGGEGSSEANLYGRLRRPRSFGFHPQDDSIVLLILAIWPFVYFAIVGNWFTKFVRYLVPLYPFLALISSKLLIDMINLARKQKILLLATKLLLILTLSSTFLYATAFMSIYTSPQTRIMASRWTYANVPSGSKILTEHWDDGLPLPIKEGSPDRYRIEALAIYEPDNQAKLEYYADKLSTADFIILNSRRLYGTLMFLPEKYPLTSQYYRLLFLGQLGYELVAQFTSYPRLEIRKLVPSELVLNEVEGAEGLKLEINDDASEESFQVYDHPKVLIFKNVAKLTKSQFYSILFSYTK